MRIALLLLLAVLLFSCTENHRSKAADNTRIRHIVKNDLTGYALKGKVKCLVQNYFMFLNGPTPKAHGKSIDIFNRQGFFDENRSYTEYGSLDVTRKYKYDKNSRLIEIDFLNADDSLQSRDVQYYDGDGNDTESIRYLANGSIESETIRKYDGNGDMAEETEYDPSGELTSKRSYIYDNKGNCVEDRSYNEKNVLTFHNVAQLDSSGDIIEFKTYYSSGELSIDDKSKYDNFDDSGNWLKENTFSSNGDPISITERQIEYYK